jgi:AraC-like DNA-binding protein
MKSYNGLKIEDLNRLGDYTHTRSRSKHPLNQSAEVMQGSWSYQLLGDGLGMHYVDMEEVEDISFSNQSPAGISFNLIYEGKIEFTVGNHHYWLEAEADQPICGCFSLNKPEMRTRHANKGARVRKINVFAGKKWLIDRCQTEADRKLLNQAFNAHAQLITWQPSATANQIVSDLIKKQHKQSFTVNLQTEALILDLLSIFLDGLFEQLKLSNVVPDIAEDSASRLYKQSKQLLDENLDDPMPLSAIAERFNVSVSTLQRRFKEASGMTVVEYIRLQKLSKAKRDLIEGGLSIGEVAYSAGYKHVANFVSAFKREYSMSPAAYRKLHIRERRKTT